MAQHPLRCFGSKDVSERERRLIGFNERGPSGGSSGDADSNYLQKQIREHRAKAEFEMQDTSPAYQRFVKKETEREIREGVSRHNSGGSFKKIRNIQDQHVAVNEGYHIMAGHVRDPHMSNAWDTTQGGMKTERERQKQAAYAKADKLHDAEMAEYRQAQEQGTPLWNTQYFLRCNPSGRQGLLKVWAQYGVNPPVPDQLLAQYSLVRTNQGIKYLSGSSNNDVTYASTNSPGFVQRQPGQQQYPQGGIRRNAAGVTLYPGRNETVVERAASLDQDIALVTDKLIANAKQSSGKEYDYWVRCLELFRNERRDFANATPKISDFSGDAFDVNFQSVGASHAHIDRMKGWVDAWAEISIAPANSRDMRTQEEKNAEAAELVRAHQETQKLLVDFVNAYIPAAEYVDHGLTGFQEKKEYVMKAVVALNAFGSHLYKYYRGTEVDQKTKDAYTKVAVEQLKRLGKIKGTDTVVPESIPAGEEGIQKLLHMRSELLRRLALNEAAPYVKLAGVDPEEASHDLPTQRWSLHAARKESQYLKEHDPSSDAAVEERKKRLEVLGYQEGESISLMEKEYMRLTDKAYMGDDLQKTLNAAQAELYFLRTNVPDSDRIAALDNKNDADPGIIQISVRSAHEDIKVETDKAKGAGGVAAMSEPDLHAYLDAIQQEGRFLRKHTGMLLPSLEARMSELVTEQAAVVNAMAVALLARVPKGADAVKRLPEVAGLAREIGRLSTYPANVELLKTARQELTKFIIDVRPAVKALYDEAEVYKDRTTQQRVAAIDAVLPALKAEYDILTSLSIEKSNINYRAADLLRLGNLRRDLREKKETELAFPKDGNSSVDSFRQTYQLLMGEEKAMRVAYANEPEKLEDHLKTLNARKQAFFSLVETQAKAAIEKLDPKTSTVEDVDRANALLASWLRLKLNVSNNAMPIDAMLAKLQGQEYADTYKATEKLKAVRGPATERFVRSFAGKPLTEFPTRASETVRGVLPGKSVTKSLTSAAESVRGVQTLRLMPDGNGTFVLPEKWNDSLKEATLYVNGEEANSIDVHDDPNSSFGDISPYKAISDALRYHAQFYEDGGLGHVRLRSFKPLELRLDGVPVLKVEPQLPRSIAGYAVEVKDYNTLTVAKDGYALQISANTNPDGYYLWDGSGDGYHIATHSGGSMPIPNKDPLGFFDTLPDAIVALEAKIGGKTTIDKMKDWSARNKEATQKLTEYFSAEGSPTKARNWTLKNGLSFYEEGKDYGIASIDLLRRDDNFLRMSRPSDVRYGSETKEYPSVEALIADMPKFFEKKELPPLASVLGRPLEEDDMRILDERKAEVAALPEDKILALIEQVRAFDQTGGDSWGRGYVSQILPLVAPKSVRLFREYANRLGDYRRTGMLGYNAGFDSTKIDAPKLAEQFVSANPEDPVTLREIGLSLQYIGEREQARPLLEKALDKGDIVAGIVLVAINEGSIAGMRPYLKKVLVIARKENKDQPLIKEIEAQLAAMEKEQPEAKSSPAPEPSPKPTSVPGGPADPFGTPALKPAADPSQEPAPAAAPIERDSKTVATPEKPREDYETPIRQADAIVDYALRTLASPKDVANTTVLDARIQQLEQTRERIEGWNSRFEEEDQKPYAKRAGEMLTKIREAEERLLSAKVAVLLADPNPSTVIDAATIIRSRYMQLQVEQQYDLENSKNPDAGSTRDLDLVRQRLWKDLNGTTQSVLPQAIAMESAVGQDLVLALQKIEKQLAAPKDAPLEQVPPPLNAPEGARPAPAPAPAAASVEPIMPEIKFDLTDPKRPL